MYVSISEFFTEFSWSKCLSVYHDHTILITQAIQQVLILTLQFFHFILLFQNCFSCSRACTFQQHFRISLALSARIMLGL